MHNSQFAQAHGEHDIVDIQRDDRDGIKRLLLRLHVCKYWYQGLMNELLQLLALCIIPARLQRHVNLKLEPMTLWFGLLAFMSSLQLSRSWHCV